ncbi:hypothetical protein T459_16193 [Capsicum annuum]|uniref:Uncharacterized protein n=1 Tax=Capsicum annuum TaxID=4072 RepID=A0A2G2Z8B3_CAPAN|nr:hypothetical protein T459_16193 [Capsicum annuum]
MAYEILDNLSQNVITAFNLRPILRLWLMMNLIAYHKADDLLEMSSTTFLPLSTSYFNSFASILVDEEGYIVKGSNVNVAFINSDKELILSIFDKILIGCTALRLLQLTPKFVEKGHLKCVKTTDVTVEDAK